MKIGNVQKSSVAQLTCVRIFTFECATMMGERGARRGGVGPSEKQESLHSFCIGREGRLGRFVMAQQVGNTHHLLIGNPFL